MQTSETSPADPAAEPGLQPDRLAARGGTTVRFVDRLVRLGLVQPGPDGSFANEDVPRVRLALALERFGVSLEDFARGVAAGTLSLEFAGHLFEEPHGLLDTTRQELLDELGLARDWSERLAVLIGLSPDPGDRCIHEDEAELIRAIAVLVSSGMPEDQLGRALQVYGDVMQRISGVESELWKENIVRPLLDEGRSHQDMLDRTTVMAPGLLAVADRLVLLLHRRYLEDVVFRNTVEWLEAAMEEAGVGRRRESIDEAIVFLDLAGYTRMTEEGGDEVAAEHALELFDLVRRESNEYGGRPVKFLGDGVMLHFPVPSDAVRCSLDLVSEVTGLGLPPAHVGINAGPLITKDADYFGHTVNVAARIADYARPNEVLVGNEVASASRGEELLFVGIGPTALKGVADPVELFVAARAGEGPVGDELLKQVTR